MIKAEPKLSPVQEQNGLDIRTKSTKVQFSEELALNLVQADTTPLQDILNENSPSKSLEALVPQDHMPFSPSREIKCQSGHGLLQSSNMIFEPYPQPLLDQQRGPLQSSLLTKGTVDHLQFLNLTAVENPSLSTLAKRNAHHVKMTLNKMSGENDEKDPSPFSSIVQFPPPVIQPTVLPARRARSAEVLTASQDIDDSLLDFMFVDL